jgi:hypothetical protein
MARGCYHLNLLLSHDLKANEICHAKCGRDRDVSSVTAAPHDYAADPGMIMTRIQREPTPIEKHLKPSAEVHWVDIDRHADVAEIACAIACGYVHAAAKRNCEMGEVAAHADAFPHRIAGGTGRTSVGVAERTSINLHGGASGGPVFFDGHVFGVASSSFDGAEDVAFVTPASALLEIRVPTRIAEIDSEETEALGTIAAGGQIMLAPRGSAAGVG